MPGRTGSGPPRCGSDADGLAVGHDFAGLLGERGVGREDLQRLRHDGVREGTPLPGDPPAEGDAGAAAARAPRRDAEGMQAGQVAQRPPLLGRDRERRAVRAMNPIASSCTSNMPPSSRGRRQGLPSNTLLVTRTASATSRSRAPVHLDLDLDRPRADERSDGGDDGGEHQAEGDAPARALALVRDDDGETEARRAVERALRSASPCRPRGGWPVWRARTSSSRSPTRPRSRPSRFMVPIGRSANGSARRRSVGSSASTVPSPPTITGILAGSFSSKRRCSSCPGMAQVHLGISTRGGEGGLDPGAQQRAAELQHRTGAVVHQDLVARG